MGCCGFFYAHLLYYRDFLNGYFQILNDNIESSAGLTDAGVCWIRVRLMSVLYLTTLHVSRKHYHLWITQVRENLWCSAAQRHTYCWRMSHIHSCDITDSVSDKNPGCWDTLITKRVDLYSHSVSTKSYARSHLSIRIWFTPFCHPLCWRFFTKFQI